MAAPGRYVWITDAGWTSDAFDPTYIMSVEQYDAAPARLEALIRDYLQRHGIEPSDLTPPPVKGWSDCQHLAMAAFQQMEREARDA